MSDTPPPAARADELDGHAAKPLKHAPADTPAATELDRIFRLLRFVLIAVVVAVAIWLVGDVLTVIFASTLFAVVLHGLSIRLARVTRIAYPIALTLVTLALLAAITLLFWSSGPQIANQVMTLRAALGTQIDSLHTRMETSNLGRMALAHVPESFGGDQKSGSGSDLLSSGLGSVTGFLTSAFGVVGTLAVVLIAGLYFALSPALYANGILRVVPEAYRPQARELLLVTGRTLWAWTIGQALDMCVVGILSGIGCWVLGVPLALALGVVAGLCNFIPYIGAIMGAIPAVLLGLSHGTETGLEVAGLYVVIQFFEGNVLAPVIQRRAVQMPPGVTILSQTIFSSILGAPGLILASPLTAALLAVGDKATSELNDQDRIVDASTGGADATDVRSDTTKDST
ncbi:transporter [Ameyamaea chiangmaiensis NBRC 103196]|uniref:AI-2E family transporter n=1 Tax=Ameyamaea chiangmaiensis TaxID=442969 RepID=A0A850PE72_9PROT|nr:AI-2E family transporter [Ameyamaea chiangmaiensis]MBS4074100.1 AI-2E family transporter [Ameyamaea chiangmaiensis]NVN40989.1 AI-2E family transporter [Ameyamaea chiangmaiensis]GBQ67239.1 transporter [Ameyamaea chiangmaiensis NBRC 103196]